MESFDKKTENDDPSVKEGIKLITEAFGLLPGTLVIIEDEENTVTIADEQIENLN